MGATERHAVFRSSLRGDDLGTAVRPIYKVGLILLIAGSTCAPGWVVKAGSSWDGFATHLSLIQGCLGILLILMAAVLPRRIVDRALPEPVATVNPAELPLLRRLRCSSCGADAPLSATESPCVSCGAVVPVPPEVADTVRLRAQASEDLGRAARILQRARLISPGPVRFVLVTTALLWLWWGPWAAAAVADNTTDSMTWALALASGAVALALGGGIFRVSRILLETERVLPKGIPRRAPAGPARGQCSGCGAELAFSDGQLALVCGYCGAESMRSRVAAETTLADARSAHRGLQEIAAIVVQVWRGALRALRWNARVAVIAAVLMFGLAWLWRYVDGHPPRGDSPDPSSVETPRRHRVSKPAPKLPADRRPDKPAPRR